MTFPTEDTTELLERIADLEIERDFERERADNAMEGLRVALKHMESYEPQLHELRRQLEHAQKLLDHATKALPA